MSNFTKLVMFLIVFLGLCWVINPAKAETSVSDVEKLLVDGNYVEAKKELDNILKEYPDSIVAHKYMIEVLKLEHAATLKYDVAYKIHEEKIKNIETAIAEAEYEKSKAKALNFLLYVFGLFAIGGLTLLLYNNHKKIVEKKKAVIEENRWYEQTLEEAVHYGAIINTIQMNINDGNVRIDENVKKMFNAVYDDHDEVLRCINMRDINKEMYNNHIRDVRDFLVTAGLANADEFN